MGFRSFPDQGHRVWGSGCGGAMGFAESAVDGYDRMHDGIYVIDGSI